jgi:hypothetical protein
MIMGDEQLQIYTGQLENMPPINPDWSWARFALPRLGSNTDTPYQT